MFPSWSRADVPNEPFSCPDAISTDTDHPLVNHHSFISPINSPPRLILAFNFKTGVEPFGKNWKFIEGGEERKYGGISYIESAKQTRYSNRFASICTNASSLIFLFLLFLFFPSLEREREGGTRLEYTLCFPLWRSVFDQMREEGTALSLVASVRYNPREGFRRRLRLEVEDLHRNRIQRRTKSDFSKFRFPAESRSHPSVFPSSSFFSLESFGSKVGNESCLDRFFFFSMHKTSSDYNEASYSELFFSGKGGFDLIDLIELS